MRVTSVLKGVIEHRPGEGNAKSVMVVRGGGGDAPRWGQEGNNRSSGAGEEWRRGGAGGRPWGNEIKKGIHSTVDLQPQLIEMNIPGLTLTSHFLL